MLVKDWAITCTEGVEDWAITCTVEVEDWAITCTVEVEDWAIPVQWRWNTGPYLYSGSGRLGHYL